MSKIVASYQLEVTLRREAQTDATEASIEAPTIADVERIATEALGSYKAAFGVDEVHVRATRTDE